MSKIIKFIFAFTITLLLVLNSYAQDKPEMADIMRENGKIYVVVAVCMLILIGLFLYLFFLDKKMTRIEKNKES